MHREGSLAADEDFKPTPIPLNDWNGSSREEQAGTLQEIVATDVPPTVAAIPAHYWEDALRHSVYLTLVRDKIDQLIAKGSVISPDSKPDHTSKEVDDHDLWEKIKKAPFDRLSAEEPAILNDITIMAKGRLLEEKNGFRFTEDEASKEKCNEDKCMEGVKAFWSVKRVRQRDVETNPGKYHYELTFSVKSQTPKKQKNPYENLVRTFTVREGTPVEQPHHRRQPETHAPRPQRAVWFHKNIVPTPHHQTRRPQQQGLDRLFSSWFSSDEDTRNEPPKRYKQVSYVPPMYPQHSKIGQVGAPTEQYQHKKLTPYPYKPQSYKYSRPPLGPPPLAHSQHHHIDLDAIRNQNQFVPPQTEYKYLSSNVIKTTKPAVLPTPPGSYPNFNVTMEVTNNLNNTESTTKDPEIITAFTMYSKPKPTPTKVSYFPDHVRPPIFNAPPGVFVTMDKKPFKPMPPLKFIHSHKPTKNRPVDFRPSPQVLDVQFSDPDPLSDAFRPITMGYTGSNTSQTSELADSGKDKPNRKSKPPKKHDNIKSHRITTSAPDIITAHSDVFDEMHWANILGAFTKTTPMASQRPNVTETTTPVPSTTTSTTTAAKLISSTTTEAEEKTTITTTTSKPRRTRPPPTFPKSVKVKKHKRVTSTTTTSTTTTTTEKAHSRRPLQDLTPQASSAASGSTKSVWKPKSKIQNDTLSTTPMTANESNVSIATTTSEPLITTMKIMPTTYRSPTTTKQKITTTTTEAPNSSTEIETTMAITLKNKNRYRQSTLMYKGTSVKHDKWNAPSLEKNNTANEKSKPASQTSTSKHFPRRKGSNFQGYVSSTPKIVDEDRNKEDHIDHVSSPYLNVISLSSTTETKTEAIPLTTPKPTQSTYEESAEQNDLDDPSGTDDPENEEEEESEGESEDNEDQETKDHDEYIFNSSSTEVAQNYGSSEQSNEVEQEIATTTEETIVNSIHSTAKNKTKCKKKKLNNLAASNATKSEKDVENEVSAGSITTTTDSAATVDFFDQIFGLTVDQNETGDNKKESKYVDNDEDLEEFLESINEKKDSNETNDDEYADEDKEEHEEYSPFNNEEENRFPRHAGTDDYEERPYSFLELMAME